jgi:hypothetical protein
VGPASYEFVAGAPAAPAQAPSLTAAPEITPLPSLLAAPKSDVYRIAPSQVFAAPLTILIPLPENCREDADIYYYSESTKHTGWYPAQNVSGFMEPGTRKTVEVDGQKYIEVQVNHGGVVQLGQTIRMNMSGMGSVDIGYTGSRTGWLLFAGTILALSLTLAVAALRSQKN